MASYKKSLSILASQPPLRLEAAVLLFRFSLSSHCLSELRCIKCAFSEVSRQLQTSMVQRLRAKLVSLLPIQERKFSNTQIS